MTFTLYTIYEIDQETYGPRKFGGRILKGLHDGYAPEEIKTTGDNFGTFPIDPEQDKEVQVQEEIRKVAERTGLPEKEILVQYNQQDI